MQQFLEDITKPYFWITTVILAIILGVISNFISKFLYLNFKRNSEKRRFNELEKNKELEEIAKAIADDPIRIAFESYKSLLLESKIHFQILCVLLFMISGFLFINIGYITTYSIYYLIIGAFSLLFALYLYIFLNNNFDKQRDSEQLIESAKYFHENKVDLSKKFSDKWQLSYFNDSKKETEIIQIKIGNRYFIDNKHIFNLKNVEVNDDGTIKFWKVNLNGITHHIETLIIMDENNMEGVSSTGFNLHYKKI